MIWQIITGEYPPDTGGVSDYTRLVARGLAAAGDEVHVWTPRRAADEACDEAVLMHRLPGGFGVRARRCLDRALDRALVRTGGARLLIQYVPQAFGLRGMNLPFCLWLYRHRRRRPIVMFHEVMYPLERGQALRHNLLGATSRTMARLAAGAADQIFVSTPTWSHVLRRRVGVTRQVVWLPLPSTIAPLHEEPATLATRQRYAHENEVFLAHFSTYPAATRRKLATLIPRALTSEPRLHMVLLGRGGIEFRATLPAMPGDAARRLHASGPLTERDLSLHLSASDLMLQLYPDGASARRTTLLAGLAHGRALLSTSGPATEPLWKRNGAVMLMPPDDDALCGALLELIADGARRAQYAAAAATVYRECFALEHTIKRLRAA
jgi:glycosyltransferase involved in cell wall biosynthesis